MNTTMTWSSYFPSTYFESDDKFNRSISNPMFSRSTANLAFGITISSILLLTACFFYVFCKIHASGVRETLTDPNNVRFVRRANEPIEMHVVPNNPPNNYGHRMPPGNSMLTHPFNARTTHSSRNDHTNARIVYKLQMHPENVTV